MARLSPRAVQRNMDPFDLFAWAAARDRRYPLPVRLLAVRHRLPLARAALVAELAGIGTDGVQ